MRGLMPINMKPKFILPFIILCCGSFILIGQSYNHPPNMPEYDYKKWHFGFTLGPEFQNMRIVNNSNNLKTLLPLEDLPNASSSDNTIESIYYYSDIPQLSTGFHVGIITSLRLGEFFNLRMIPSLSLGQRNIVSNMFIEESIPDKETFHLYQNPKGTINTTVKSTYISLPILFKYKAVRIENVRPYMVAGANFKYDLATDFDEPITLKKVDNYLEFGLGSDFYMHTFRLGIEVRFGIGLLNTLNDRPKGDTADNKYLTSSMDKIKAKTLTIAINFE